MMRTLLNRSLVALLFCACAAPTEPGSSLMFRLGVEGDEPHIVFLGERGGVVQTFIEDVVGTRGLRVSVTWRYDFLESGNSHLVAFDRIARDGHGTTVRFRADVDGVIAHYIDPDDDAEPVEDPPGG